MAENYKMEAADIKTNLGEEGRKQLMEEIAVKKAVDFVVDNAKEK